MQNRVAKVVSSEIKQATKNTWPAAQPNAELRVGRVAQVTRNQLGTALPNACSWQWWRTNEMYFEMKWTGLNSIKVWPQNKCNDKRKSRAKESERVKFSAGRRSEIGAVLTPQFTPQTYICVCGFMWGT